MLQIPNYGDERQTGRCVYCGEIPETRDHLPPRVLLDEPFPENLPVVEACRRCNQSFSLDEEYVACVIECVLAGSTNPNNVQRGGIRRSLHKKPALRARLEQARTDTGDGIVFTVEAARVESLVVKLARGHASFELNDPRDDEPAWVAWKPSPLLANDERDAFEEPPVSTIFPEVGSRAMMRQFEVKRGTAQWLTVQEGRYRYLAAVGIATVVRIVIREYLFCEVGWGPLQEASGVF